MKITGRIKDIIVTSGGKNISPQNIENTLVTSSFIEQVAIIGDNRKYLSALIVPSFATLESWAKDKNISFSNRQELIKNPEVIKLFEHEIEEQMKDYARVEQIRKFLLMEKEWSQDSGEMTPTMKLKRSIIRKKFEKEIESLYPPE
jgi:long-chain acyl-CoA synthetase